MVKRVVGSCDDSGREARADGATTNTQTEASMFGGGAPPDRKIRYLSGGPFSMSSDLCIVVD